MGALLPERLAALEVLSRRVAEGPQLVRARARHAAAKREGRGVAVRHEQRLEVEWEGGSRPSSSIEAESRIGDNAVTLEEEVGKEEPRERLARIRRMTLLPLVRCGPVSACGECHRCSSS